MNIKELQESFKNLSVNEWPALHKRIIDYRTHNKVTISQFLQLCNLLPTSYFKQLCCKNGNTLNPSDNKGSIGKNFRDAVCEFLDKSTTLCNTSISGDSLQSMIDEFVLENYDEMKGKHVVNINLRLSSNYVDFNVTKECQLSNHDLYTWLVESLKSKFEIESVNLLEGTMDVVQLLCGPSPLALNVNQKFSTGTCL